MPQEFKIPEVKMESGKNEISSRTTKIYTYVSFEEEEV